MVDGVKQQVTYSLIFILSGPAIRRERDELLALLDIKERNKYEKSHSQSSDEEFSQYSTIEVCLFQLHARLCLSFSVSLSASAMFNSNIFQSRIGCI